MDAGAGHAEVDAAFVRGYEVGRAAVLKLAAANPIDDLGRRVGHLEAAPVRAGLRTTGGIEVDVDGLIGERAEPP